MVALHKVDISRSIDLANVFFRFIHNSSPPTKVTAPATAYPVGLPREAHRDSKYGEKGSSYHNTGGREGNSGGSENGIKSGL